MGFLIYLFISGLVIFWFHKILQVKMAGCIVDFIFLGLVDSGSCRRPTLIHCKAILLVGVQTPQQK